jgi:pyrroloquinoline quinone biosynthesis protein D
MPSTPDARLRRATKASWQDIEGETILLLMQEEKLLGLNRVAGRIWQLADGTRTAGEIAASIADDFEGPRQQMLEETLAFVLSLTSRGLLEEAAP